MPVDYGLRNWQKRNLLEPPRIAITRAAAKLGPRSKSGHGLGPTLN